MDALIEHRVSKVDRAQAARAIKALYLFYKQHKDDTKKDLLQGDSQNVEILFSLKKIPQVKNKWLQLRVDHPLAKESREVCLLVKDVKGEDEVATVEFFQELLKKSGVDGIAQIIPYTTICKEYKTYEARRRLANSYDFFLADDRILHRLPARIGKYFYQGKKPPIATNVAAKDLKGELEKVLNSVPLLISGRGSCLHCVVSTTSQSEGATLDNVVSCCQSLTEKVPRGWENVKSIHLKLSKSPALPIYTAPLNLNLDEEPSSLFSEETLKSSQLSTTDIQSSETDDTSALDRPNRKRATKQQDGSVGGKKVKRLSSAKRPPVEDREEEEKTSKLSKVKEVLEKGATKTRDSFKKPKTFKKKLKINKPV